MENSFSRDLKAIGLNAEDVDSIMLLGFTDLQAIINARVMVDGREKDIYHICVRDATSMFLRVVVGIGRFRHLDNDHIKAVFYQFEEFNLRQACLENLDKFNEIMFKFWSHRMSKPLRVQILDDLKQKPDLKILVKNIELFGFKFHYTRSNKPVKRIRDSIKIEYRTSAECRLLLEQLYEDDAQMVIEKDKWNYNRCYKIGYYDGYDHGLVSVPTTTPIVDMMAYIADIDSNDFDFDTDAYKSGWLEGWKFGWLDSQDDFGL